MSQILKLMYSFLYTALQNLLPAHYFITPIAKIGNLKYVSYFFVLNGGKNSIMGNLLPRTLGLRGGMQAIVFGLARLQILCYDCFMFNLKDKFYVCGD